MGPNCGSANVVVATSRNRRMKRIGAGIFGTDVVLVEFREWLCGAPQAGAISASDASRKSATGRPSTTSARSAEADTAAAAGPARRSRPGAAAGNKYARCSRSIFGSRASQPSLPVSGAGSPRLQFPPRYPDRPNPRVVSASENSRWRWSGRPSGHRRDRRKGCGERDPFTLIWALGRALIGMCRVKCLMEFSSLCSSEVTGRRSSVTACGDAIDGLLGINRSEGRRRAARHGVAPRRIVDQRRGRRVDLPSGANRPQVQEKPAAAQSGNHPGHESQ